MSDLTLRRPSATSSSTSALAVLKDLFRATPLALFIRALKG